MLLAGQHRVYARNVTLRRTISIISFLLVPSIDNTTGTNIAVRLLIGFAQEIRE